MGLGRGAPRPEGRVVALVVACSLPDAEVLPEPEWSADCDGWGCPGATVLEWGEGWAVCEWECSTWDGQAGVDVSVSIYLRPDGCWHVEAQSVTQRDCSWVSY